MFAGNYRITSLLPDRDRSQVEFALEELRSLLGRNGLKEKADDPLLLEITLAGRAELAEGAFDYRVTDDGRQVEIKAAGGEGLRCGINHLMEELGVRHFRPDEAPLEKFSLPLRPANASMAPALSYRGLHICAGEHHYDADVARWMSHLKMNRKLTHLEEVNILGEELASLGLKPDTTAHSYSHWISDEKYFAIHPEYFSLIGGKRVTQRAGGQLCLANGTMRREFAANIGAYIETHPDVRVVGIPPNDGYGWCECEACRSLDTPADRADSTVNGRVADFVCEIADRVGEKYPQVLIGHYSYSNFADFAFARQEIPANTMISYTISRCFKHSLGDPDCPVNRPLFARMKSYREKLEHIYTYEYYTCNWDYLPAPIWRTVAADMKDLTEAGCDGFMTEVGAAGREAWKSFHLPIYVAGRFLWNPDDDLDAILDDYCSYNYGPAAGIMRAYLDSLEAGLADMEGCFTRKAEDFPRLFTPAVQQRCVALLQKSLQTSEGEEHSRIEQEKALFDRWVHICAARLKNSAVRRMAALPMDKMSLTGHNGGEALPLLEKTSLLVPEKNRTLVTAHGDDANLGLSIECFETEMESICIRESNDANAVYGSDNLEIFLAPSRESGICYQFMINPAGYSCACECDSASNRWNWSWPGRYRVETARYADRWVVSFSIPKEEIGIADGGPFYFLVVRNRKPGGWTIDVLPPAANFRDPQLYIESR